MMIMSDDKKNINLFAGSKRGSTFADREKTCAT